MTDHVLPDAGGLAAAAADWFVGVLAAASGPLAVSLSGGSTPKLLYELLAAPPRLARMPWDRVHWFWGDERFVPHDDERSNYRMAMEAMLGSVSVPPANIHPIPTDGSPEECASRYQAELQRLHGSASLDNTPLFHVVLMGMGTNGHTASLFPGTPSLTERMAWAVPVRPAGEPTRITLTYPALESCVHAAFLVAGADKRDVLARVRGGDTSLPSTNYHPRGTLDWFVDRAADPAAAAG